MNFKIRIANYSILPFSIAFACHAFCLDLEKVSSDTLYNADMRSFCGPDLMPIALSEANKYLNSLNRDELKKTRDVLEISDEGWYQVAGVYKTIENAFGIKVSVVRNEFELLQKKQHLKLQKEYELIREHKNIEEDTETPQRVQDYFAGKKSLDELFSSSNCAISETIVSCFSKDPKYMFEVTDRAEIENLTMLKTTSEEVFRSTPGKILPGSFDSLNESQDTKLVRQNSLVNMSGPFAKEIIEDSILYNLTKKFGGRSCIVYQDRLQCPLTEEEKLRYGVDKLIMSEATFDKYGIYLGNRAEEKAQALQKLQEIMEKPFDKKDPRWMMSGSTDFSPPSTCGTCHDKNGMKPVLQVEREFTSVDRERSARETADKFETGGRMIGLTAGAMIGIYDSKGVMSPSKIASTAIGGLELFGAAGKALGWGVGYSDYKDRTDATGPIILPSDHPKITTEGGVVKENDGSGEDVSKKDYGVGENKDGTGQPHTDPFVDNSKLCTDAEKNNQSCKILNDDGELFSEKLKSRLCLDPVKIFKNRERVDAEIKDLIDDSELLKTKKREDSVRADNIRLYDPDCLDDTCKKAGEMSSPFGIRSDVRRVNIHRDCTLEGAKLDSACKNESKNRLNGGLIKPKTPAIPKIDPMTFEGTSFP